MARTFTNADVLFDGLRDDVLWLMILIFCYRERALLPNLSTMSREDLVVEFVLLGSAVRDIVTRLTSLDGDEKGVRSFQSAFSALKREGLIADRTEKLKAEVRAYRSAVNSLKVEHRNKYIAHVQELANVTPNILDRPVHFERCASICRKFARQHVWSTD
ncbi:hypothetical protein EN837_22005 [bacterium M00.F.Ca.ET.194.01.1.1]|nr:hypothetical protein EN837_22005 [bacterium M00.F.Ca.ET.194.01.1.1]TGS52521.1 hypothetical protein EN822_23205 [bacterium M00.F.Ca.ET.179.01.1.1]TGV44377.1 hypothetical protein EN811_23205 [bacterium M00.F.Ca.ET.168.01.1.1]